MPVENNEHKNETSIISISLCIVIKFKICDVNFYGIPNILPYLE